MSFHSPSRPPTHINRSPPAWIDSDFTDLAEYAAQKLPDVTITRDLMPSTDGLLVWSRPVTRRQIAATSWTVNSDGWKLVNYRTIGGGLDGKPLQRLREQVGWLAPTSTVQVHEQHVLPGDHPAAALLATWLLIAQQAAEITTAEVDKAVRKTYARTNRPAPEVRIVRIRANHGTTPAPSTRSAPGDAGRSQTSRFWVRGHWRNQPYGPGRALRRPVYINPFLRSVDRTIGVSFNDTGVVASTLTRTVFGRRVGHGSAERGESARHRGARGPQDRQRPGH
jgi:hypothetical protein